MKLEHVALNVSDPQAMAEWYVQNLGLTYAKQSTASPFVTFISDDSGKMMIELYNDPAAGSIPNYAEMSTLLLHVAYVSDDPRADQARLVSAGATFVVERPMDDGGLLIMLRDPWGLALQLCKRAKPMLKEG